jgi:hypothetical protein
VEEESTVDYEVSTVNSSLPEDSTRLEVNLAGSKMQTAAREQVRDLRTGT